MTVTGSASAPATHAIGQIVIRNQYAPMPPDDPTAKGTVSAPEVSAEDVQAVVDASDRARHRPSPDPDQYQ